MSGLTAMVLAAGRGERLRPLTDSCPKPLVPVAGQPLIEYSLDQLQAAGVERCVINLSWLGEKIRAHLESNWRWSMQLQFSTEAAGRLETGGGIFQALPMLGDRPFLVVNADVYCDYPLAGLRQQIADWQPGHLAHLLLVDNPSQHPQGDFHLRGSGLVSETGEPRLTYAGISLMHPDLFAGCEPGCFSVVPLLRKAMGQQAVSGQHVTDFWTDVGTLERLDELNQRCSKTL